MVDLPGQGSLQPVGNMARHFLVQPDCSLAQARIELGGALDLGVVGRIGRAQFGNLAAEHKAGKTLIK